MEFARPLAPGRISDFQPHAWLQITRCSLSVFSLATFITYKMERRKDIWPHGVLDPSLQITSLDFYQTSQPINMQEFNVEVLRQVQMQSEKCQREGPAYA